MRDKGGYALLLLLGFLKITSGHRSVITFYNSNPCERAHNLPACAPMVKCYSHRLVINTDACDVTREGMAAWVHNVFDNATVAFFEEDPLITTTSNTSLTVHGSLQTVHGADIPLVTIVTMLRLESLDWAQLHPAWCFTSYAEYIPTCVHIVTCSGQTLDLDMAACSIHPANITAWLHATFANTTNTTVEILDLSEKIVEVPLNLTVTSSSTISLGSQIWADRWWPVSGPHGLRAREVWEFTNASSETVVAILDSGLPPLATPIFANIVDGYDFISDELMGKDGDGRDASWEDPGDSSTECPGPSSWHGTQVAAVLAANMDQFRGVATNVTILPIRVLGACQTGHASDVADAVVWASGGLINNVTTNPVPATIISMSFSGVGQCPSYLQSAVRQAISNGCVLLAAAGNNDGASSADYFPGNCEGVIVVEASTKSGVLAPYSNNRGTLAAPGGDSTNPVVTISPDANLESLVAVAAMGTSLSVPLVAGFLALGLELHGPAFNLGDTLTPFTDDCTMASCGAGIVSFYGTAHATLLVVNNTASYQCSSSAVRRINADVSDNTTIHTGVRADTYDDVTMSLNTTSGTWVSSEVACYNPPVHAATSSTCDLGYTPGKAVRIEAGYSHTCAILNDTRLECWGSNSYGQLGDGSLIDWSVGQVVPVQILYGAVEVSLGSYHTCAILSNGVVMCWGGNDFGQLGDDSVTQRLTPVAISSFTAVQVSCGQYHACALASDGTVQCWGYNAAGQLGDGSYIDIHAPSLNKKVNLPTAAVQISTGTRHNCALLSDGTVWCWGENHYGQLGGTSHPAYVPSPVAIDSLSNVIQIDCGVGSTCALLSDGTVWCWGNNQFGQLGHGSAGGTPGGVDSLSNVIKIDCGNNHVCALLSDGTVWCWGKGMYGQIGDGTGPTDQRTPVEVDPLSNFIQITCGGEHTCAILSDHTTKCWGKATNGQIGIGTLIPLPNYQETPAAVVRLGCESNPLEPPCCRAQLYASYDNGGCAVTNDNEIRCWGVMRFGNTGNSNIPQLFSTPSSGIITQLILPDHYNLHTTDGYRAMMIVLQNGTVMCQGNCWGTDNIIVNTATAWVTQSNLASDVVVGMECGFYNFCCAILFDTTVKCYGYNNHGENGVFSDSTSLPTLVMQDGVAIKVSKISAGQSHTCAILILDQSVVCWGANAEGQLGTDSNSALEGAQSALLDQSVIDVVAGYLVTCAVLSDNTVKCWGFSYRGALGNGHPASTSPIWHLLTDETQGKVDFMGGMAVSVTIGGIGQVICAGLLDGTYWCWGKNDQYIISSSLGYNTYVTSPVLQETPPGTKSIVLGRNFVTSITSENMLFCRGHNSHGECGQGNYDTTIISPQEISVGISCNAGRSCVPP
jgi:alpha-tubulin suppressor-like RCC1 family protein